MPNYGRCITPNRERALCIHLEDCKYLYGILTSTPLLDADKLYLSRSQCGYFNHKVLVSHHHKHFWNYAVSNILTCRFVVRIVTGTPRRWRQCDPSQTRQTQTYCLYRVSVEIYYQIVFMAASKQKSTNSPGWRWSSTPKVAKRQMWNHQLNAFSFAPQAVATRVTIAADHWSALAT